MPPGSIDIFIYISDMKQPNLDPSKLDTVICECGSFMWEKFTIAKRIPGLLIGASQETLMQLDTLRCMDCKKVMPEALPLINAIAKEAKPKLTAL